MRVFVTVRSIRCPPVWIQKKRKNAIAVVSWILLSKKRDKIWIFPPFFPFVYLPMCSWLLLPCEPLTGVPGGAPGPPGGWVMLGSKTAEPGRPIMPRLPAWWWTRSLTSRLEPVMWLICTWPAAKSNQIKIQASLYDNIWCFKVCFWFNRHCKFPLCVVNLLSWCYLHNKVTGFIRK